MASKIPAGDVWNIIDNDEQSQWFGKTFRFDFSYISNLKSNLIAYSYSL